jgi:transposase
LEEYESMTKEELVRELVRSKIREARLKKGYEVKGVGVEKVFIPLNSKNIK